MYISFLFFCHLCLLYFTVRVEQSAIHARGCCFCHPSTFQNPGPQSAKWTHPKKFLLNKSPMEVHPDISAEPMNSVNFRVKFQLSRAFLPFPLPFGLSGSTQAFAGPIWAASLSFLKKTNPRAHLIVLIFSFSSWGLPVFVWTFDPIWSNLHHLIISHPKIFSQVSTSLTKPLRLHFHCCQSLHSQAQRHHLTHLQRGTAWHSSWRLPPKQHGAA